MRLGLVLLSAWGVPRISHINDQPVESWGLPLGSRRRPDADTLDQYLQALIELDEVDSPTTVVERLGQIRPGGMIDRAQQASLQGWVAAGLLAGEVWYFDDHVVEYTGQARLGKTKHGTKQISVKAVTRYTLHNGLCSLSEYFPLTVSYAEAMRHLVTKANACLPTTDRIRKLAFDRAGWDAGLLSWLQDEQQIVPITWVKRTPANVKLLEAVSDKEFVELDADAQLPVGKERKHQVVRVADTSLDFPHLGQQRVVVLETQAHKRIGIYTTALHPGQATLADQRAMTTIGLMDAMRLKQRIENSFKLDKHEMDSDAIPTHKTYTATFTENYDWEQAQRDLNNAQRRLEKYTAQEEQQQQLHQSDQLNQHQLKLLNKRTQRLRRKAEREIETLSEELGRIRRDQNGQTVLTTTTQVLDVRKLTLLHLFKSHARVALKLLARQLDLEEAGPNRLRRAFLAFGDRVEFDHDQQIATVYARPFPRAQTQQAYERLCSVLTDVPIKLTRNGISYRVQFSW
ncbi:MAG: hypothetical protein GY832_13145 [Chloroflexi bacterium]|nr:hypothetical protein [Chloroflexota bacterium]